MDNLKLINECFEKGFLLNKKIINKLEKKEIKLEELNNLFIEKEKNKENSLLILNENNFSIKNKKENKLDIINNISSINQEKYPLNFLNNIQNIPKKYEIRDFTKIFISRYKFIESILRNRQELSNILSINKIKNKKNSENVSLIGIVSEINQTKTGTFIFVVEDLTSQIKIIISKNKKEIYDLAQQIIPDEVIGITGTNKGDVLFAENIIWPEIPSTKKLKKYNEEIYSIFLSDIHIGSTNFLEEEFNKFLKWINGETGNQKQKELSQKIKYIFIAGDLVDGIGIYQNQDKELTIKDITEQYNEAAKLLKKIPSHIQIIICPGNHDALHLAEPQPAFNSKYVQSLIELPNVSLVNNPSLINICQTEKFSGFDILLYHGYSFDYYVANVNSIRNSGGYERADLIMKFLLRKRHLAPSYGSAPYFPNNQDDFLLIKKIPDFFITGHIHYSIAANYRGVTMISGSCWQSKTDFQEKVGHEPQPARIPIVNLKTREIKILKFI